MAKTARKYAHLEKRLLAEKIRLQHDVQAARESAPVGVTASDEPSYGNHLADEATTTFDQQANLALERHMQSEVEAIDNALRRMADGTYGRCEECGQDIGIERLEAMPTATLCIRDKAKSEARR